MSNFTFIQINNRNLEESVKAVYDCCNYTIGFEVTQQEVINELNCNIDPQHTGVKLPFQEEPVRNISCAKWVLQRMESIFPSDTLCVLPSKLDLDCVVACVLYVHSNEINTWEQNGNEDYQKLLKLCDIVNTINTVDCGLGNIQGHEWNPDHHKANLVTEVTWYQILSAYLADFKVTLNEKVEKVWQWLNDGSLTPFVKYANQVSEELLCQEDSLVSTVEGVTLVQSNARGATGILYSEAPYGVCYNNAFPTPNGKIRKFTICEFTSGKYIDLQGILDELTQLEEGWGGNLQAGIIGSPFSGTTLDYWQVCSIVADHIK